MRKKLKNGRIYEKKKIKNRDDAFVHLNTWVTYTPPCDLTVFN